MGKASAVLQKSQQMSREQSWRGEKWPKIERVCGREQSREPAAPAQRTTAREARIGSQGHRPPARVMQGMERRQVDSPLEG